MISVNRVLILLSTVIDSTNILLISLWRDFWCFVNLHSNRMANTRYKIWYNMCRDLLTHIASNMSLSNTYVCTSRLKSVVQPVILYFSMSRSIIWTRYMRFFSFHYLFHAVQARSKEAEIKHDLGRAVAEGRRNSQGKYWPFRESCSEISANYTWSTTWKRASACFHSWRRFR